MAKGSNKGLIQHIALGLTAIALGFTAVIIYANTLVEWWIPLSITAVAAAALWMPLKGAWRKWLQTESGWTPPVTHFAAFILGGCALLLALNYFCADDSTIHREDATVVSKETHKRHHSRRVGRRRYTTGEPYYVYDLNLQFADGRTKSLRVDASRYNRTRTGATLTLPMEKGLLGWPVIMRSMPENMPENAQKDTTVE